MKPPVLLTYNLHGERAAKIRMAAMRFHVRLRAVEKREYARPLGELVESGPEGDWDGEAFDEEMLVMAHFPPGACAGVFAGAAARGRAPRRPEGRAHAHERPVGFARAAYGIVQGARGHRPGRGERAWTGGGKGIKNGVPAMLAVGTPSLFYSFGSSLVQCGQRVALSLISPKQ